MGGYENFSHFCEKSSHPLPPIKSVHPLIIPRTKRRSIIVDKVQLPEKIIVPHKKPPVLDKERPVTYDNTFASSLSSMWKLQRKLQSTSCNQLTSYRYVGYVSSVLKKLGTPKTTITFLPVIRNPITQYSTVIECTYQSMKYSAASNMKYVHITTDAGAACKFYQVVWNNPEEFKKVIIHLGDFHAMVEFFGIIGKIVSGSGFEDVVYQADLCTSGGMKGVLSGKHYNRAWSVHEVMAEALHRVFLERESDLLNVKDEESCNDLVSHPDFITFVGQRIYDMIT